MIHTLYYTHTYILFLSIRMNIKDGLEQKVKNVQTIWYNHLLNIFFYHAGFFSVAKNGFVLIKPYSFAG